MAKDPAFLFYPGDWLGGTIGMSFEEKGAYMELLMMQFSRGHMTTHMIGQTVGQLWVKLQDKFVQDGAGLWYNVRLDAEKEKRKKYTDSRKNNVSGVNQHKEKVIVRVGHMTSHMENRNENGISIKKELYKTNKEAFEDISGNYKETESQLNIVVNLGWRSATTKDTNALLFHFLESQTDLEQQGPSNIKNHFRRWLNATPITKLQELTKKIHERQQA